MKGIQGIHHVGISVPDIELAEDFYGNKLGMETVWRWDFESSEIGDRVTKLKGAAAKTLLLRAGNIHLEIFEFQSPIPEVQDPWRPVCDHGFTHLGFEVARDDIHDVYRRLEEAGVKWHTELTGEISDSVIITYGRDPFGNVIEIQAEVDANRK